MQGHGAETGPLSSEAWHSCTGCDHTYRGEVVRDFAQGVLRCSMFPLASGPRLRVLHLFATGTFLSWSREYLSPQISSVSSLSLHLSGTESCLSSSADSMHALFSNKIYACSHGKVHFPMGTA